MVIFLILSRSLRVDILKQLFFLSSVNSGFKNSYPADFAARYIHSHYSPRFQRIIVRYFSRDTMIMAATDSVMIKIALFYPKQYIAGFMTSRTSMCLLADYEDTRHHRQPNITESRLQKRVASKCKFLSIKCLLLFVGGNW